MMKTYKSVDQHITDQSKATQALLKTLRATIRKAAPQANEVISYGIPTFDLYGHLVHFAGYEKHIGFYPGPVAIKMFKKELAPYETSKGTVQFSIDKALPLALIAKMVRYRVIVNLEKAGVLFPKLSAPATRALQNAKILTLKQLSRWTEKDLLNLHGIGPSSIPPLRNALKRRGLSFKKI